MGPRGLGRSLADPATKNRKLLSIDQAGSQDVFKSVECSESEIGQTIAGECSVDQSGISNMDSDLKIIGELFAGVVPEVADGNVKIVAVAREQGYRSKVAIRTLDDTLDGVAVCVGERGNRIKQVVNALGGERIDLIRWNDDLKVLIANALQPAEVEAVVLNETQRRATVFVAKDQQSLVSGRRGANQRLAESLSGYEIVVETT